MVQGFRSHLIIIILALGMAGALVTVSGCIDEFSDSGSSYSSDPSYDPYSTYSYSTGSSSGYATIYVRSYPVPSYIYIDGEMVDSTWDEYEYTAVTVPAGYHTLEVTKPGYGAYSESLYIGPYEEIARDVYLQELYAPQPTYTYPVYTPAPTWEDDEPAPTYVIVAPTRPIY